MRTSHSFSQADENSPLRVKTVLIPSPNVATYDLQPEMSARKVTDELITAIHSGNYDAIVATMRTATWLVIAASWSPPLQQ